MSNWSASTLQTACIEVFANAKGLLADAELLYLNGRLPRAMSSAILAQEELAKLVMLRAAQVGHATVGNVDGDRLRKRLRDHREKLGLLRVFDETWRDSLPSEIEDVIGAVDGWGPKAAETRKLDLDKQSGFYVSVTESGVCSPMRSVDSQRAAYALHSAKSRYRLFEFHEGRVRELPTPTRPIPSAYFAYCKFADLLVGLKELVALGDIA